MYAPHNGIVTDYVSGEPRDGNLVKAARRLELEFVEKMGVYTRVPRAQSLASGKGKIVKGRWIDVNRGSSEVPEYRSQYVGKEFNRGQVATSDRVAQALGEHLRHGQGSRDAPHAVRREAGILPRTSHA